MNNNLENATTFYRWMNGLSTLLFPRICVLCGNQLFKSESLLCRYCLQHLPRTHFEAYRHNKVEQIFWGRVKLEYGFSIYYFRKREQVQQLMHEIKYRNNRELAFIIGQEMGRILKDAKLTDDINYLIPVPLHEKKLRIRGYNQSELICNGLSDATGIPLATQILQRANFTSTQTNKARYDRWENVENSFVVNTFTLGNNPILLIDDVITTGAPLEACCHALLQISGAKVSVGSVAYASD